MPPKKHHTVIIGGGVVGLCSAHFSLKEGHSVTVLERSQPEAEGCSHGNAGLLVPSHFVPLAAPGLVKTGLKLMLNPKGAFGFRDMFHPRVVGWVVKFLKSATKAHTVRSAPLLRDLNLLSKKLYADFSTTLPDFGYSPTGLMMVCKTGEVLDHEAEIVRAAHGLGLRATILSPSEVKEMNPGTSWDCAGAVYFEDDAHINPNLFLKALRDEVRSLGGNISHGVSALGWEMEGDRVAAVKTDQGTFPGSRFILAAGVWSTELTEPLGLRLPMVAGTGCSFPAEHPTAKLKIPVVLIEARVAVTPMGGGLRFAGAMEIGLPGGRMGETRIQGMREAIEGAMPDFDASKFLGKPVWQGARPCSPDGVPYLGAVPSHPEVIVAAGHAMMGLSLGPASGLLAAQLASDKTPSVSLENCRPERFG